MMKRNLFIFLVLLSAACDRNVTSKSPAERTPEEERAVERETDRLMDSMYPQCVYTPFTGKLDTIPLYQQSAKIEIRAYETPFNIQIDDLFKKKPIDDYLEQIFLNKEQKDSLFRVITGFKKSSPIMEAACFDPRHSIIFYDSCKKEIGHIYICFGCNVAESDLKEFKHICDTQLVNYYFFFKWCGLTKGFNM